MAQTLQCNIKSFISVCDGTNLQSGNECGKLFEEILNWNVKIWQLDVLTCGRQLFNKCGKGIDGPFDDT